MKDDCLRSHVIDAQHFVSAERGAGQKQRFVMPDGLDVTYLCSPRRLLMTKLTVANSVVAIQKREMQKRPVSVEGHSLRFFVN